MVAAKTPPADNEQPEPVYSTEQVRALINTLLDEERVRHAEELAGMRVMIEGMARSLTGTVPVCVPEHSGGSGTDIAPTWSKYEQENSWRDREMAG